MDVALFFVFLICDLIIVPICWFSYGKQGEYREGMVMGVSYSGSCCGRSGSEKNLRKDSEALESFSSDQSAAECAYLFPVLL